MSCPDELVLETLLLGGQVESAAHIEGCPDCQAKLDQLRSEGEDFKRFVFPATIEAVLASQRKRRWWVWLPVPLALAAGLAVFLVPRGPADDYVGLKGSALAMSVYTVDSSGAAERLDDRATVGAAAALRFQIAPTSPCYLWLVSTDQTGEVSRLYPPQGEAQQVSAPLTLPGGATLDGKGGPERLFAVCTEAPVSFEELSRAARVSSAEEVRALRQLAVKGRAAQGTLLLEKQP